MDFFEEVGHNYHFYDNYAIFNPQPKPAQQATRSRPNLPVLHWKRARAINLS